MTIIFKGDIMKQYKCQRCKYEWYPRNPGIKPKECPNCKSRYWSDIKG